MQALICRAALVAAVSVLTPSLARAAEAEPSAAAEPSASSAMKARQIDVRGGLHTSAVFQYAGAGLSADVGLKEVGPGTLSAGASIAYDGCTSTCWGAPLDLSQNHLWHEGRLAYHVSVPRMSRLDLYPLVTLGLVYARAKIQVQGSEYRASDLVPTFSLGAGASYFLTKSLFVAGEGRIRYAGGAYDYELARGPARRFDASGVRGWSVNTIDLTAAVGARF